MSAFVVEMFNFNGFILYFKGRVISVPSSRFGLKEGEPLRRFSLLRRVL